MLHEEPKENQDQDESIEHRQIVLIPPDMGNAKSRLIGLYGEIGEENCPDIIAGMYELKETGKEENLSNPEDENSEVVTTYSSFEFLISTEGGLIWDAFAVFDVMKDIQKQCEISTIGIGKVMSAGLLLLAAGTPGKRKVGKYCRLMIHSVSSGNFGHLHDLKSNIKETTFLQEQYIKALSENSKLTRKKILSLFKKKTDIYFSAEQAIEWGLADEII